MGWIWLAMPALAAAAYGAYRLYAFKKQLRALTAQLARYNRGESRQKLQLDWHEKDLESLAEEVNRHTDLIVRADAERKRTEAELRQAVANVSHDLRTPLTSISGYIQLLDSQQLSDAERREAIAVVRKRTRRLEELLRDFYELALLDSPDYALRPTVVRLGRLLPDALLDFYDRLSEQGIEPAFLLTEEPLPVFADESAVKRVAENVMLNTLRHATERIEVELAQEGEFAVLTVRNGAPHLTGSDPELLFNRFYMADRSRAGSGSGLGLSIARGLMEKMGGRMTAEMAGDTLIMRCEWPLHRHG